MECCFRSSESPRSITCRTWSARHFTSEMGMCLYGNDIDDTTSPLEAGLGWITKFSKDFVSSQILAKQKEDGLNKEARRF